MAISFSNLYLSDSIFLILYNKSKYCFDISFGKLFTLSNLLFFIKSVSCLLCLFVISVLFVSLICLFILFKFFEIYFIYLFVFLGELLFLEILFKLFFTVFILVFKFLIFFKVELSYLI